jgi:coproporphyrinogen III oxidase-like Fe-S oxidoreductase
MPPYSLTTREDDPVHIVRMIGRLAQMIIELRDVYAEQIAALEELDLLHWHGDRLKLTRRGLLLANDVAERFLPE